MKSKTNNTKDKNNSESGNIIVEAAIVFPVMFFVLFFIIFIGNMLYEQARIDDIVNRYAILGAQCISNPLQYKIEKGQVPTDVKGTDIAPYRYIFGNNDSELIKELVSDISADVKKEINDSSLIFFDNSKANKITSEYGLNCAYFNRGVFQSSFVVQVNYEIRFPIRFFMEKNPTIIKLSSRAEVSVDDAPEFIRNVDFAIDLLKDTKIGDGIASIFKKVNEVIDKFK